MNAWLEHVANAEAYSAEDFILASGGFYPHLQLFNPVASGVRVRLRSVHMVPIFVGLANIRRYDPPGAILGPPAPFIIENLLGGGPPAVAELRSANLVATAGSAFWLIRTPGNTPGPYPHKGLEWGHDLLEGDGVLLQGPLSTTLIANWQWVELPL